MGHRAQHSGHSTDELIPGAPTTPPGPCSMLATTCETAKPKRRVFPGRPDQARHARQFVARALHGCPALDTAVLLTSELVTNALKHTRSAAHGTFQVVIWPGKTAASIAVIDDGSDTLPAATPHDPADLAESGRGLDLVQLLSTHWGHYRYEAVSAGIPTAAQTLVWFQLEWAEPPTAVNATGGTESSMFSRTNDDGLQRADAGPDDLGRLPGRGAGAPDFTHLRRAGTLSEGCRRGC